ncbi:MAG: PAS domain S-box protein [Candidatus Thorarchaeota archaeon]
MSFREPTTPGFESAEQKVLILSKAIENNPASIVITNREGDIVYINPKFVNLTGYTSEEALSQNPRILKSNLTPPETHEELWETLTSGKEWRGVFANRKKNGDVYWEDAWISPIKNDVGETTHYIAVKEDITARVEHEKRNEMYQKELELFSSLLRHDLTNDAQIIRLNIGLLRHKLKGKEDGSPDNLEIMDNALQKMTDLLALLKEPITGDDLNIVSLMESVKDESKRVYRNLEVTISVNIDPIKFKIERAMFLPIVFTNLIRNSANYCGGNPHITITISEQESELEIVFSDNGPGIQKEIRERLFQKGVSTSGGGYGLYLSRAILNIYNSSIELLPSIEGEGAKFRILIPQIYVLDKKL